MLSDNEICIWEGGGTLESGEGRVEEDDRKRGREERAEGREVTVT